MWKICLEPQLVAQQRPLILQYKVKHPVSWLAAPLSLKKERFRGVGKSDADKWVPLHPEEMRGKLL